jgi:3-methyl-2-oxobutanoate hydroxymethyltransferase
VKQYASIAETINSAISKYIFEVKNRAFPEEKHSFNMKEEELHSLYGGVKK